MKLLSSFLLVALLLPSLAQADVSCLAVAQAGDERNISQATQVVLTQGRFVDQEDFDHYIDEDGGGACAPSTAFNALEILREAMGLPLLDAKLVLGDAYKSVAGLTKGRVSNRQFLDLLEHLKENYLPAGEKGLTIMKQPADSRHYENIDDPRVLSFPRTSVDANLLSPAPHELKILTYDVFRGGSWFGRHFVVLKSYALDGKIEVIDPNDPLKPASFTVQGVENGQWELKKLGSSGYTRNFLDTVFTLELE